MSLQSILEELRNQRTQIDQAIGALEGTRRRGRPVQHETPSHERSACQNRCCKEGMVAKKEAHDCCQEREAKDRQTQLHEFCDAKEALDANESQVGQEEESSLSFFRQGNFKQ